MKKEVKDEIHKDILGRINHAFVPDDHDDDQTHHDESDDDMSINLLKPYVYK